LKNYAQLGILRQTDTQGGNICAFAIVETEQLSIHMLWVWGIVYRVDV
jgi:hypothetical protein